MTDYDPVFVAASFDKQMYFVASEHTTRWGVASKFLKNCFEPIVRYKGTTAASTVIDMLKKVREGKCVCMFAEGARSWDGVTAYIQPATGKVVKTAKCALVTYRMEGGYFVSPNWSEGSGTRKGHIQGKVVNVYTREQLAQMSVKEINEAIANDLHEDAYERQLSNPVKHQGKNIAERMENVLFICPKCGAVDSMHSAGDTVRCDKCDLSFRYNEYAMLEGAPFETVKELFAWEKQEVIKASESGAVYTSSSGELHTVSKGEEVLIAEGAVSFSGEMLVCGEVEIPFTSILDLAMHGWHSLVFSTTEAYYDLTIGKESNALKFHLLYEAYQTGAIR